MAENQDGQERSEEPTAKRKKESRDKGEVPRSKELNTMTIVVIGSISLMVFGGYMVEQLMDMMRHSFTFAEKNKLDGTASISLLGDNIRHALRLIAPFLLLMVLVALLTPTILGGFVFSAKSLKPKFSKLNPFTGIKKIFSVNGLMELLKSIAKVTLIGSVFVFLVWQKQDDFLTLGQLDHVAAISKMGSLLVSCLFYMSLGMILIAAVDAPFQIWQVTKQMKMTKQEVRDEMKDQEGKPEVKQRIRQMQQELAFSRMMDAIPDADVIITNPTHYAVALKYDHDAMRAPVLLAKGTDLIAERIRELARENNVPLVAAPPLARAIFASTDLRAEIPAPLYVAVAQVLAFVFQLNEAKKRGRRPPKAPSPEVSEEFMTQYGVSKEPI